MWGQIPKHESSFHTNWDSKRGSHPAKLHQPKPSSRDFLLGHICQCQALVSAFFYPALGATCLEWRTCCFFPPQQGNILLQWPRAIWRVKIPTNAHCVKPGSCQRKTHTCSSIPCSEVVILAIVIPADVLWEATLPTQNTFYHPGSFIERQGNGDWTQLCQLK